MNKTIHDSETPATNQQVITACAFIYKRVEKKVMLFLPKRAPTKKFLPNKFELPGGHINFGESLEDGLKREIKEELNVDIIIKGCFHAFTYINEVKGSHSVEILYFAQFTSPESEIKLNPEDHSEYIWVDFKDYLKLGIDHNDEEAKAIIKGFKLISFI